MTLVERLRKRSVTADDVVEQTKARLEAADRLEALEEWDRKRAADLMTLGGLVGRLEAALQEIAELSMVGFGSWDEAFYQARDIARKALGEE